MSQTGTIQRPFYYKYAWAYDSILDRPAVENCNFICKQLYDFGMAPGGRLLDAGCGTGEYALYLASVGKFEVTATDQSEDLLNIAKKKKTVPSNNPFFAQSNLLSLSNTTIYDAILCKGVLNDLITDKERQDVLSNFGRALKSNGILIFDVRDWVRSYRRKIENPIFKRTIKFANGSLSYKSITSVNEAEKILEITETHTFSQSKSIETDTCHFRMKCWTMGELGEKLAMAGFTIADIYTGYSYGYDPHSDRTIIIALKK